MRNKTSEADPTPAVEGPPPKPRGKMFILLGAGVAAAVVGVGALWADHAGYVDIGIGGSGEHPSRPRLMARSDAEFAASPEEERADPRRYSITYYPIAQTFTSNLNDRTTFVQLGLGVSTYYDERVLANLQRHEMAVRSAVLMTLADQDPQALATADGKRALQGVLKGVINDVLRSREGFGGVDGVYFTSLVMQ